MSCVDWNVLKTIADFPLCFYAFLQSSAPSSLGTGYFVSLSQLPHVCLALGFIFLCNIYSLGCGKKSRKFPLSPEEQTDVHPFTKSYFIFKRHHLLGTRVHKSVSKMCLVSSTQDICPSPGRVRRYRESCLT